MVALYAIADPARSRSGDIAGDVTAAIRGGAGMVQLRHKAARARDIIALARTLKDITAAHGVPLIINDRADIALASGADGVHLGAHDLPPRIARDMLGRGAIIGATVHNEAEAETADIAVADYFGIGPFAVTSSKADALAPLGPSGLARLCASLKTRAPRRPIYAIAGITARNAPDAIRAGAHGVAVISALFMKPSVEDAARSICAAVENVSREMPP